MSDRVKQNVAELSNKILAGWTLLNESCPRPTCNVPLVRGPDKRAYCCSCQLFTDDMEAQPTSTTGGQPPLATDGPLSPPTKVQYVDPVNSQGSKLSSGTAPGSDNAVAPRPVEQAAPARAPERQMSKSDKASSQIASKLLQGWALLDDLCPRTECRAPLMRNREKQLWCVACDARVLSPEETDALGLNRDENKTKSLPPASQPQEQPQRTQHQTAPAPAPAASQPAPQRSPQASRIEQPRRRTSPSHTANTGLAVRMSDRIAIANSPAVARGRPSDVNAAIRTATEALSHTLQVTSTELLSASTFERRRQLLTMVQDCISSLGALGDLS